MDAPLGSSITESNGRLFMVVGYFADLSTSNRALCIEDELQRQGFHLFMFKIPAVGSSS